MIDDDKPILSTDHKQRTCDQRIADEMSDREGYAGALFAVMDGDFTPEERAELDGAEDTFEAAVVRLDEWPLGVETYKVMRIDLSTGGPADWLEVKLSEDGVEAVTYHFADWFDHAEERVREDSALWRLAEYYAEAVA